MFSQYAKFHALIHRVPGYRYFSCARVQQISYHQVRPTSPFCLLKAKVSPSMSVNSSWYEEWVIVEKDSGSSPGGRIESAYCTCTAGMHGSCNHIAGLLFRVETFAISGQMETSSTSLLCRWNIPTSKTDIIAAPATDLAWNKDHFSTRAPRSSSISTASAKQGFTPLSTQQASVAKKNPQAIRARLAAIATNSAPTSRFSQLVKKERVESQPPPPCPPSLPDIASEVVNKTEPVQELQQKMKMSHLQCQQLEQLTQKQSSSTERREQRKGRITASNYHRINSRMTTLEKDPDADPSSAVASVMGYDNFHPTKAMKHGISCEPHAKKPFRSVMRPSHKNFQARDSGMAVKDSTPILSASPDLLTSCDCCGQGLCEIKCPYSLRSVKPTVDNVPFIESVDDEVHLKTSSEYFSQIQGQMGITGRSFCDLFIFTFHGFMRVRVMFDSAFFKTMTSKLEAFWWKFVVPELMSGNIKKARDQRNSQSENQPPQPGPSQPKIKTKSTPARGRKTRKRPRTVYLCVLCSKEVMDDPQNEADNSINCDLCDMWCHFTCVGIVSGSVPKKWLCPKCV